MVNRAFIDSDKRDYIQLHVLEDLIDGDRRLLKKLFYSLIKHKKKNEARGLYERHDMSSWRQNDVDEIANKIVYDPTNDQKPVDQFGPISNGK